MLSRVILAGFCGLLLGVLPATAQDEGMKWKVLSDQAVALAWQARYSEAADMAQEALSEAEQAFGPEHPTVALCLSNLAGLYHVLRRDAEAEPLIKRALTIREKAFGPNHREVATSLNDLAGIYQTIGRHSEAEPLCLQALSIREKALGPDDPVEVAQSLYLLAAIYEGQNRPNEAEPMYKRLVAILQAAPPPKERFLKAALGSYATCLRSLGKFQEAGEMEAQAAAVVIPASEGQQPAVETRSHN